MARFSFDTRRRMSAAFALWLVLLISPACGGESQLATERFGTVALYRPNVKPDSVVLFLSGDGGWKSGVVDMAHALVDMGAVVVGIDTPRYLKALRTANATPCQSLAVDLEALSHLAQRQLKIKEYSPPVLIGYSSGATLVYATLVQSPPGTFAGAMSLGFCSDQDIGEAQLCPGYGLKYTRNRRGDALFEPASHLREPWVAFQGQQDRVCNPAAVDQFVADVAGAAVVKLPSVGHGFSVQRNWLPQFRAAYRTIVDRTQAENKTVPVDIQDLPVTEVTTADSSSKQLALLMTGDGGWAGLDQDVSARLAALGTPVVGFNSLKYFWTHRTPEQTAADVTRVLRHYLRAWSKTEILLVGYSFGADVMPFVVNRLPADLRARVVTMTLVGLGKDATWEVHVSNWIPGLARVGSLIAPEMASIDIPLLCLYGADDHTSLCPSITQQNVRSEVVGQGHHLGGEYTTIADRILEFARAARR
ncbi:MAG: virulence factor family protein [Pseudomonadales bacterium]|nr:virulence factor family protein [Pseudomonadales bacterium]